MNGNGQEFSLAELQELSIVLEVDIRVSERLGVQSSEMSRRLLTKVNKLIVQRSRELNFRGPEK